MFWRMPGMASITATATNTAPAVARTGRSQPSLSRSRSGTLARTAIAADRTAGTALRRASSDAELTAAANASRADFSATAAAARNGGPFSLRAVATGGITDLRSPMRYLKSKREDLSQPRSSVRLSRDCSCAILCRIRSRPSPDGTTPSAAACSARRRRSPYSASGSVMIPAPGLSAAPICRAPYDFLPRLC